RLLARRCRRGRRAGHRRNDPACRDRVLAAGQPAIPALAALAHMIGDPALRNHGTIERSIANNDPTADYPAAVVGLGGTVQTTRRQIAADDFVTGTFETAL